MCLPSWHSPTPSLGDLPMTSLLVTSSLDRFLSDQAFEVFVGRYSEPAIYSNTHFLIQIPVSSGHMFVRASYSHGSMITYLCILFSSLYSYMSLSLALLMKCPGRETQKNTPSPLNLSPPPPQQSWLSNH